MSCKALNCFIIIAPILPNRSAVQQRFAVVELLTELQKRKCIKEQISKSYDQTTLHSFLVQRYGEYQVDKKYRFYPKVKVYIVPQYSLVSIVSYAVPVQDPSRICMNSLCSSVLKEQYTFGRYRAHTHLSHATRQ